jgi:hypothetical protein
MRLLTVLDVSEHYFHEDHKNVLTEAGRSVIIGQHGRRRFNCPGHAVLLGLTKMITPELRQLQGQQLQSMQEVKGLLASREPVRAGRDMAWECEKAVRDFRT